MTKVPRPSKSAKKGYPEAVMTLLASAEEHGRSRPEPTVEIEEIPLDDSRPDRMVRVGQSLAPPVKEAIVTCYDNIRTSSLLSLQKYRESPRKSYSTSSMFTPLINQLFRSGDTGG